MLLISCGSDAPTATVNNTDTHGDFYAGNDKLSSEEYVNYWVNLDTRSDFVKSKKIAEFNYTLKYLPLEFLISNDLGKTNPSQVQIDSLKTSYEGMEYYELKISIDDFKNETIKYQLQDMGQYQNRLSYVSFSMQNDITMVVNQERIAPCKLYHFERTFGLAPYMKVLIGFSKEDMSNNITERTIVFNDNLFNKGLIKFNWSSQKLLETPKITVL